jgi:hypothetical protein
VVPAEWQPVVPATSGIAGLDPGRSAVLAPSAGLSSRAVLTIGPVDDPSLIPRALRAQLQAPPPRPRNTALGGRPAWRYSGLATRVRQLETMDVTVLPTTSGVVAVACGAPPHTWPAASGCESAVQSVSVPGAATLVPSPSVALAARLPAVVARLDRERVDGRAALSRAETRTAQALAARRLAHRHLAAADALRPAHGAAWRSLVAGLVGAGHAYAALARAASDGSVTRFDAARRLARRTEARLAGAIDGALANSARRTVPSESASSVVAPRRTDASQTRPPWLLSVLLALAGAGAAGFLLSKPTATAAGAVRRTAWRLAGAPRRRPATTTGRPAPAWRCEITWQAGSGSASFRAETTTPEDKPCVIAESTTVQWPPPVGPDAGAELAGAARQLERTLIEAGWTPAGSGPEWYARRFVWTRPTAPVVPRAGDR